jgi:chromatin segregation and condensation protein Rec8/ScpA/Scc1 (kleisin family)
MWSKFLLLAAVLLRLTGSALAQGYPDVNVPNSDERRRLMLEKMQELRQQKRLDDAYRAARNKIPNQKLSDPWADVRPPPATPAPKNKPQ